MNQNIVATNPVKKIKTEIIGWTSLRYLIFSNVIHWRSENKSQVEID